MLVEEATAIGIIGKSISNLIEGQEVLQLLSIPPTQDVPIPLRDRNIKEALASLSELAPALDAFGEKKSSRTSCGSSKSSGCCKRERENTQLRHNCPWI